MYRRPHFVTCDAHHGQRSCEPTRPVERRARRLLFDTPPSGSANGLRVGGINPVRVFRYGVRHARALRWSHPNPSCGRGIHDCPSLSNLYLRRRVARTRQHRIDGRLLPVRGVRYGVPLPEVRSTHGTSDRLAPDADATNAIAWHSRPQQRVSLSEQERQRLSAYRLKADALRPLRRGVTCCASG